MTNLTAAEARFLLEALDAAYNEGGPWGQLSRGHERFTEAEADRLTERLAEMAGVDTAELWWLRRGGSNP